METDEIKRLIAVAMAGEVGYSMTNDEIEANAYGRFAVDAEYTGNDSDS